MSLRQYHRWVSLAATLLVVVVALSGAVLSVQPGLARLFETTTGAPSTLAELVGNIARQQPDAEVIRRSPNGVIRVEAYTEGKTEMRLVNPRTGQSMGVDQPSPFFGWLTEFHRSLFLSRTGRLATGLGAVAMILLSLSGLFMAARRQGGWRRLWRSIRGQDTTDHHLRMGRWAMPGLLLSAVTGMTLSLSTLDLLPAPSVQDYPTEVSGATGANLLMSPALRRIPLSELRELTFPYADDPTDSYHLVTTQGEGYLDQGTGELLVWQDAGVLRKVLYWAYRLHTGEGVWWLGLLLGASALSVPHLGWTGIATWWRRHRGRPRLRQNQSLSQADTVILVGSEGGLTQGFAHTLHRELNRRGHRVHTTTLNQYVFAQCVPQRLFILTSTYGDGEAPASADRFLANLAAANATPVPTAVLGFGDRRFPDFCGFAERVSQALAARGWPEWVPLQRIDRQSVQAFARWGEIVGQALGHELRLNHRLPTPTAYRLTLVSRDIFGDDPEIQTAVLRFALPKGWLSRRPRFKAGDLMGIRPPGDHSPRHYSLASSLRDGFVEICVRRHPHGRCSTWLHDLQPGDTLAAFFQAQPQFRAAHGTHPVVLIGAGTGIGPLAGFIRANEARRPMHLYFGARNPNADFLYRRELDQWRLAGRLTRLETAFSQGEASLYVQDRLREDAERMRGLIESGADILVCGGRDMAEGVQQVLTDILQPLSLNLTHLKAEGRYAEDVY